MFFHHRDPGHDFVEGSCRAELAGGDEQADPFEIEFLEHFRQPGQLFGDIFGTGGAVFPQETAVFEPDQLDSSKEGKRQQCFFQPFQSLFCLAGSARGGIYDLRVAAAELLLPLGEDLLAAFFDGELVISKNDGNGGLCLRFRHGFRSTSFSVHYKFFEHLPGAPAVSERYRQAFPDSGTG